MANTIDLSKVLTHKQASSIDIIRTEILLRYNLNVGLSTLREELNELWRKNFVDIYAKKSKYFYCPKDSTPKNLKGLRPLARPEEIIRELPNTGVRVCENLASSGYHNDLLHVIREIDILRGKGIVTKTAEGWSLVQNLLNEKEQELEVKFQGSQSHVRSIVETLVLSYMPATEFEITTKLKELGFSLEFSVIDDIVNQLISQRKCEAIPCAGGDSYLLIKRESRGEVNLLFCIEVMKKVSTDDFINNKKFIYSQIRHMLSEMPDEDMANFIYVDLETKESDKQESL